MNDAAIEQLRIAAEACETNAPINDARGDTEQAAMERKLSGMYRAAMFELATREPITIVQDRPISDSEIGLKGVQDE